MERIKAGFLKQMRRPPDHQLAKKLAKRFKGDAATDYFRFLTEPGIEPTNNGTERQIRPVVIDRRVKNRTKMYLILFMNRLSLIGAVKNTHQ
jgi:hypothetical protein